MAQSRAEMQVESTERSGARSRTWMRDALWLARKDLRASWMSYAVTVVITALFGLLATVQFSDALSGDNGVFGAGMLDFYLLCIVPAFGTNLIFNRDYYANMGMEGFDERLSFIKMLPVSTRGIIVGRAICIIVAIACAAPAFFVVPYLVNSELRDAVGVGAYVGFGLFWVGYAMVVAGLWYLYGSFGVRWSQSGSSILVYLVIFLGGSVLVPTLFRLLFGESIALTVLRFAGGHGLLLAGLSLLVGFGAIAAGVRSSEAGLSGRDIG